MDTKTFKADTMIETLQLVQQELGANAIVVSMREIPLGPAWNPWKKAGVEVVASAAEQPSPTPKASAALRPAANPAGVEFVEEKPEIEWAIQPENASGQLPPPLKLKLAHVTETGNPPPAASPAPKPAAKASAAEAEKYTPPALKKIQQQLLQQGTDSALVAGLVEIALETLSPTTLADLEASKKSLIELMGAGLRVQKGAGTFLAHNILCLVGASGSGKTSATAKLALYFSQNLRKSVTWVCADTVRIGAIAEARAYTDALGLTLKLVYTPQDLRELLREAPESELFLVDTPGYNPYSESQLVELGELLAEMPRRCTYLVAPATTREPDLEQLSAALGVFNLDGLVLTKLDETLSFGTIYNFARKNQLPLSFFTTGKETGRNLEVANPARLASALFGAAWIK